jgi:hypothetical protein
LLLFQRSESERAIEALTSADAPPLELAASAITGFWLGDALDRLLNPQTPKLTNTDGDPFVICTSTFPLLPGVKPAQCRAALARVPALEKQSARRFDWLGEAANRANEMPAAESERTIVLMTENSFGETVLGSAAIEKCAVVLSTNSRERAKRGEAMIAAALLGLAGKPVREELTAEEAMAESRKQPTRQLRKPLREIPAEEQRAITHAYLDKHYRESLDRPLQILGGVSPREAARSKAGQGGVINWLKDAENHAAKSDDGGPMTTYDFTWMWRELGVAALRV